ncbi:MAG: hypothetical protein QG628_690 [Patescibacteria group bacterium]|nr:hypothetical protein [Patescibacteria group bacterium]
MTDDCPVTCNRLTFVSLFGQHVARSRGGVNHSPCENSCTKLKHCRINMIKRSYKLDGVCFVGYEQFLHKISELLFNGAKISNLDAFNDMLSGGYGTPDDGFVLIWEKFLESKIALGYSETILWLEAGRPTVHVTAQADWDARIASAKRNQGQTLWMIFVDIITRHKDIELQIQP